jgi:hexosaminidase
MVVRAGAVVMVGVALILASPAVAGATNPAPEVVPAIREWSGGSGVFELASGTRIVVGSRALAGEAELLRDDLEDVTGLDLCVVEGSRARDGDVVLVRDRGLGREEP